MNLMNLDGIDFIDFGSNQGGSMRLASAGFGGVGLGIDSSSERVDDLRRNGFQALKADAADVNFEPESTRFCQAFHFLEHLPNRAVATKILDTMVRTARDFVLVIGPDFSGKNYLSGLGFIKYYGSFPNHTWQHTAGEINNLLQSYNQYQWKLIQFDRIFDSWNSVIVPARPYAGNTPRYDPSIHDKKDWVSFKPRLYTFVAFAIVKNESVSPEQVLFTAMKPYITGKNKF